MPPSNGRLLTTPLPTNTKTHFLQTLNVSLSHRQQLIYSNYTIALFTLVMFLKL